MNIFYDLTFASLPLTLLFFFVLEIENYGLRLHDLNFEPKKYTNLDENARFTHKM